MEFIGYYPQWAIYDRKFFLKTIHDNGTADKLTILNYAFENFTSGDIPKSEKYPEGYDGFRAFEEVRALDSEKAGHADAGINAGDAGADYLQPFNAATKKDPIGTADGAWGAQTLMGNFNQLKQLKAAHKQLKVLASLGGWTYSRNWSLAAKTAKGREDLVSSCIDLFIKGNLPKKIWVRHWETKKLELKEQFGGAKVAAGIFDGIDIDWEWPGCDKGLPGNKFSPDDKANFVALLKEFRKQLDDPNLLKDYPPRGGKYLLTAFLPADPEIMKAGWDAAEVMKCLDFGNIQGYDFHGGWDKTTDQQSQLHSSEKDKLSVESAVNAWIKAAGESARSKLTFGIPYYSRGWQGVEEKPNSDGLFNKATGPAKGRYEDGVNDYHEIAKLDIHSYPIRRNPAGKASYAWRYSKSDHILWTYDDPTLAHEKAVYARESKLGGVMVYSLDGDDRTGSLSKAIRAGLDGQKLPPNGSNGL
ncbi:glycoside hydrolase family 18 protein [Streptomyces sp. XD-27]|uniref:glycoside hydrolase family 18 protein n=1 Tax=Streptomyces sp. XD-27 TaxID=3062779 RepID=UPI0026F43B6A|nr:glycosyl hydrolase family 18 protein [Streptomyces sp. XD-27]WKX70110.1 glycosyl hydrolase family 18 protein [Streptomyces sp. XD-27]